MPKTHTGKASPAVDLAAAERTRADMKISLAALYGAQKSFYSEYARYSTDFNALGYSPEGKDIRHKTGFQRAYYPEETGASSTEKASRQISSFDELDTFQRDSGGEGLVFSNSTKDTRLEDAFQYCRAGCTASETQFEVLSASNLDDDPDLDVWLINEKKELVHVHDDLAP